MALSDEDRAALRAEWLGEPLPEELTRLLASTPADDADLHRRQELLAYQPTIAGETAARTRRLLMAYSAAAVAKLVELMQDSSAETARKAAVDLLKHYPSFAAEELAAEARGAAADGRRLTDQLTDDQAEQILSVLADARTELGAEDAGQPRESDESLGG